MSGGFGGPVNGSDVRAGGLEVGAQLAPRALGDFYLLFNNHKITITPSHILYIVSEIAYLKARDPTMVLYGCIYNNRSCYNYQVHQDLIIGIIMNL